MTEHAPALSDVKRALLEHRLRGFGAPRPGPAAVPRLDRTDRTVFRPSAGQRRMWFLAQLAGHGPVHHVPFTMSWPGTADAELFSQCLTEITRRHEVLRNRFEVRDGELVVLVEPTAPIEVPVVRLTAESELPAAVLRSATAPFDLATAPLLRAVLFRAPGRDDVLAVTIHHIVADGWSMGVLADELTSLYRTLGTGLPSELPELPVQYLDLAAWQESTADGRLDADLAYWAGALADAPEPATVPPDRPRPAARAHRGRSLRLDLAPTLLADLRERAAAEQATPYMVVAAAVAVLLNRYAGATDVLLGTVTAGRDGPGAQQLIGFFVNTVVLRIHLADDPSATEVIARARAACLNALAHQRAPFDRVVERLRPRRGPASTPFFHTMLVHQDSGAATGDGILARGIELGTATFDLTITVDETASGTALVLEYDTELYDRDTIADAADHLEQILRELATHPDGKVSAIPLLPPPRTAAPVPAPEPAPPPRPPGGELAERVAAIWAEVLGVPSAGVHDTFFDLGGNSLLLVEVRTRLHADLGLIPTLLDLYTYPTAAGLAEFLAGTGQHDRENGAHSAGRAALRQAAALRRAGRAEGGA
ncbi:condensation domain-containing protein [Amycolatopsis mediterranei]|uniref:condensation domain-containing protein n=1 Tax=Amycolatopsis mediterranei TaxID=33910 RepID=UPI0034426E7F